MVSFSIASNGKAVYQFDPTDANGNIIILTEVEKAAVDRPDLLSVQAISGTQFAVAAKGKLGIVNVTVVGKNESGQPISTTFQFTITAPQSPVQATGFKGTQIS